MFKLFSDNISEEPVRIVRENLRSEPAQTFFNFVDFINKCSRKSIYFDATDNELRKHIVFLHNLNAIFSHKNLRLVPFNKKVLDELSANGLDQEIDKIIEDNIIEPLIDAYEALKLNHRGQAGKNLRKVSKGCIKIKRLLLELEYVEIDDGHKKEKTY